MLVCYTFFSQQLPHKPRKFINALLTMDAYLIKALKFKLQPLVCMQLLNKKQSSLHFLFTFPPGYNSNTYKAHKGKIKSDLNSRTGLYIFEYHEELGIPQA